MAAILEPELEEQKPQKSLSLRELGRSLAKETAPKPELPSFKGLAPKEMTAEEWEALRPHLEKNLPIDKSWEDELAASIGRGVLSIPETAARFGGFVAGDVLGIKPIKKYVTQPVVEAIERVKESPVLRTSTAVAGDIEEKPEMLADPRWWASRIPEAALSMATVLGGGILGRAGALFKYGGRLRQAVAAGDKPVQAALEKAIGWWTKAGVYGAGMALETSEAAERMDQFEKSTGQPLTWGQKVIAGLGTGVVAGSLEAFAVDRIFGGLAGEALVKKIVNGILTEGGTEGAQALVENAFQRWGYDPSQRFTEGMLESIIIGAAIGGLAGAGEKGYERIRRRTPFGTPVPEPKVEPMEAPPKEELTPLDLANDRGPIGLFRTKEPFQREPGVPRAPEEIPTILGPDGRPVTPDELEAALEKGPWERNAFEKWLVDEFRRQGAKTIMPETEGPGIVYGPRGELISGPEGRKLPRAFGGPRVTPPLSVPAMEVAEISKPQVPDLGERVRQLTTLVEETGDPNAAAELNRLLIANQKEVGGLFRIPEREIPGLKPIADRLESLIREVEETGDPGAARELHGLLAANREVLSGVTRQEIAARATLPPAPMGVTGMEVAEAAKEAPTPAPGAVVTPPLGAPPAPEAPAAAPEPAIEAVPEGGEIIPEVAPLIPMEERAKIEEEVPKPLNKAQLKALSKLEKNAESMEGRLTQLVRNEQGQVNLEWETEGGLKGHTIIGEEGEIISGGPIKRVPEEKIEILKTYPEIEPTPAAAKEPWEMTFAEANEQQVKAEKERVGAKYVSGKIGLKNKRGEWTEWGASIRDWHKREIERALSEGKSVPSEVLADYPDLSAKYAVSPVSEKAAPAPALAPSRKLPAGTAPRKAAQAKMAESTPFTLPDSKAKFVVNAEGQLIQRSAKGDRVLAQVREGQWVSPATGKAMPRTYPEMATALAEVNPELFRQNFEAEFGPAKAEVTKPLAKDFARRLTTEQIRERYGEYGTVSPIASETMAQGPYERGWIVREKGGQMVFVFENKEGSLELGAEGLNPEYGALGIELKPGDIIAGVHRPVSFGSIVELARNRGLRSFDHELWHRIEHWLLTPEERAAVIRDFGDNEEVRAKAYANWNPKKKPHTVFQKILNFFQRILRALTGRMSGEEVFARARRGEMFGRQPVERREGAAEKFAVQPGAEAVLAQYHRDTLAMDPENKPLWQRFWDRDPGVKESWTEIGQRVYDQVVDRFAPGERAQEKLAKAGIVPPAGERFTSTVAFWRGQEGWNHEAVLGAGVYHDPVETIREGETFFTGATPTRVGDSLFKRLEPLRQLAKERGIKNKEIFRDLRLLMVAQRDLELAGETGTREPGAIKGVRPEESRAVLQALASKYGENFRPIKEAADSIREWADQAILQRLLQGGLIDRELYDQIKARNQAYVPFMRLMDDVEHYIEAHGRGMGAKGRVIKEIKGSERLILDPLQMLIELAAKANYAYARNRMARSLQLMGQASPEMEIKELKPKIIPAGMKLKDKWEPLGKSGWAMERAVPLEKKGWAFSALPPEKGAIPFYKDGKLSWLKLPPDLYQMTQNMMPEDLGLLMRILKWPADVLRTGAVTTPEFGLVKNPLRDLVQAWLLNRAGFSPHKWFRDLYLSLSKDPATIQMRAEAAAGGGFMATLAQAVVEEKITAEDIEGKKKNIFYAHHPVHALRHLSAYLENLTRFSIYKQARENGLSHAEAVHEMRRTTLDFRRLGAHPVVRYLNMIIPFWNANIQGIDRLVTELTGPNRAAVWRRLATLMVASIGLALLFHDDDRLKELENWEKNYFWHIPLGKDGPIIRLPKPFEAGILFGSVPERLVEVARGDNPTGLQAALRAAYDAMTPEMIPAALRPLVELKSNYNFFLGRPIEDLSLQKLPVHLRAKPWTTELAKTISGYGGHLIGLSPVKVEHFVRTFSGGLGANYMFPGVDVLLRKVGILEDLPNPQQDAIERAFGVRAFFTKPPTGYRAKSVSDFFENCQAASIADQGWKHLWNTGSMDSLDKFLSGNPEAMFARVARQQMVELGKIRKERDAIHLSKTLTSEQKKARLDALDERILQLAKTANALMDPEVAAAVKMPSRFKRDEFGQRKSMDLDGYYKYVVESVGDAYDEIKKDLPRILRMAEDQRQRYLIKLLRKAREEYRPILKKPENVMKPYRFSNLLDKPTRKERATWQQTMGFRKISPGLMTGYRLRPEEERGREVSP